MAREKTADKRARALAVADRMNNYLVKLNALLTIPVLLPLLLQFFYPPKQPMRASTK